MIAVNKSSSTKWAVIFAFTFLVIVIWELLKNDASKFGTDSRMFEAAGNKSEVDLQKLSFDYKDSFKFIYLWTSICDERLSQSAGNIAVHILFYWAKKRDLRKDLETRQMFERRWKCRLYHGDSTIDLPLNVVIQSQHYANGMISCFFKTKQYECPSFVSVLTGNENTVSRRIKVERQSHYKDEGVVFCAPLIIPLKGSGFHNSHQFVEWIEYLRLAGISQVIMVEPILDFPLYPISDDLYRAILHYKKIGFLQSFSIPHGVLEKVRKTATVRDTVKDGKQNSFYRAAHWSKELWYTYCYLKYGPSNSHVMVGDFDEVPSFDLSKHGDILTALKETFKVHREKYKKDFKTFVMKPVELLNCQPSSKTNPDTTSEGLIGKAEIEPLLGTDSRLLSRSMQTSWWDKGKSIYTSNASIFIWHHWNLISVDRVSFFNPENGSSFQNRSAFHYNMAITIERGHPGRLIEDIVFVLHARRSAHPTHTSPNCRDENKWKPADWLNAVKRKLFQRISQVIHEIHPNLNHYNNVDS